MADGRLSRGGRGLPWSSGLSLRAEDGQPGVGMAAIAPNAAVIFTSGSPAVPVVNALLGLSVVRPSSGHEVRVLRETALGVERAYAVATADSGPSWT